VTAMDLVFREKRVHTPTPITILDVVLLFGVSRTEHELQKMSASRVGELMTRGPYTVGPDAALDEIATRMVDGHLSLVPVVDGGQLGGAVTRKGVETAALRHVLGSRRG